MSSIKNIFSALFLVALTATLFVFFLQNGDPIRINFLHLSTRELPLWVFVLGAFTLGCIAMWIVFGLHTLKLKNQMKKQRKALESIEKEVHTLRNLPIDDLPQDPTVEVAKLIEPRNKYEEDYG